MAMHFLFLVLFFDERFRDLLTNVPKECLFTYFSSAFCGQQLTVHVGENAGSP
jgi:hypothetical protein